MRYELHLKHGETIITGDATGSAIENAVDVLASTNALLVVVNEDGSKIVIPRENVAYITIGGEPGSRAVDLPQGWTHVERFGSAPRVHRAPEMAP